MADAPRFEIKACWRHRSAGDGYEIIDHLTGKAVPMHYYSDSKSNYESLEQLCAFLNELASPPLPRD